MSKRKQVDYGDFDEKQVSRRSLDYPNKIAKTKSSGEKNKSSADGDNEFGHSDTIRPSSTSSRVSKLLDAVNSFLQLDSKEDLLEQIGEEGYDHCKALQSVLRQKAKEKKTTGISERQNGDNLSQRVTEIPTHISITPWTASCIPKNLPKLPKIFDPALEKEVFTHSAIDWRCNYERLEWVGDVYLEFFATHFISSTFPHLSPGRCSQLRERCVKNATLAKISHEYEFPKRAILPAEYCDGKAEGGPKVREKESEKVMGDIFEAYCAAVVASDPKTGVHRLAVWLRALWARTLSTEILDLKPNPAVKTQVNGEVGKVDRNAKDLLQVKIGGKGIKLSYEDVRSGWDVNIKGARNYTLGVYLNGWGEERKELGVGTALSKKDAGMKAAEAAVADTQLLAPYEEKKRKYDEKRKLELANSTNDPLTSAGDEKSDGK